MTLFLTEQAGGLASMIPFLISLGVVFVIFYFLLIRPEKKRQRTVQTMQNSLKKNDKIVTIGGLYGIVDDVKEDVVTMIVASGARIKIERGAIKSILNRTVEETKEDSKAEVKEGTDTK